MKKGLWTKGAAVAFFAAMGCVKSEFAVANDFSVTSIVRIGPEGSGADIEVKPSAVVDNIDPAMASAYPEIVAAARACAAPRPVITSGRETTSRHMRGSLHYEGRAFDLRARYMSEETAQCVAASLRQQLGSSFDVVFEAFPEDSDRNHIHVEFDPRG